MSPSPSIPVMAIASPEDYLRAAVSFRKQRELVTSRDSTKSKKPTSKKPPASSKTSKDIDREVVVVDSETECEDMLNASSSASGDHAADSESSKNHDGTKREKCRQLSPVKGMQGISTLPASSTAASVTFPETPLSPQPAQTCGSLATTATSQPETHLPPRPAQTSESLATAATAKQNPNPQSNPGAVMVLMSTTQATVLVVVALLMAALLGAFALWLILAFDPYSRASAR
ncbi:hypothetical protein FA13DRAFT_1803480 [Coprinellus micaceus]|uniref:Uncharacterized protein n=1 Tax=Coprinellus micaceus TaxID=71717 RepID=A0A4Y7SBA2_COPMI|nr:hypothetical protein FA13DRAFT_1803480 [Coprinellus micaceus]